MTSQTEPRPTLSDDDLREMGAEEESFAEIREMLNEECDECEARGPVRFSFGDGHYGTIQISDLKTGLGRGVDATGDLDLPFYTLYMYWEVDHPPVELLRDNPMHGINHTEVIGGSDEHVATLAGHEKLPSISVQGLVTEEDVARAQENLELEITAVRQELEDGVAAGEITQEEMDELPMPTLTMSAGGQTLTDAGLRSLKGHQHLSSIRLSGAEFSDEALAEVLPSLPKLDTVVISAKGVTGEFLTSLEGKEMVVIGLQGDDLDPAKLTDLPSFPTVLALDLVGPKVLDGLDLAGLKAAFPSIEALRIGNGAGVEDDRMLPVFATFPGVEVNGLTLSRRAAEKAAAKRGVTLPDA